MTHSDQWNLALNPKWMYQTNSFNTWKPWRQLHLSRGFPWCPFWKIGKHIPPLKQYPAQMYSSQNSPRYIGSIQSQYGCNVVWLIEQWPRWQSKSLHMSIWIHCVPLGDFKYPSAHRHSFDCVRENPPIPQSVKICNKIYSWNLIYNGYRQIVDALEKGLFLIVRAGV